MVLTATLCFHFALSANLWFKPALDAWSGCIDLKGVIAEQLPTYGSKRCHFMPQVSIFETGPITLPAELWGSILHPEVFWHLFLMVWAVRLLNFRQVYGDYTSK